MVYININLLLNIGMKTHAYCLIIIVILECQPGSFSSNGVEPCTQCSIGTYSNANGATACDICPESSTTLAVGSTECVGKTRWSC